MTTENDIALVGPETFEDCHVCGHQPQHTQYVPTLAITKTLGAAQMNHRDVCTYCNEGTDTHDSKAYAGLNWNGKQLRAKQQFAKLRAKKPSAQ